MKLSLFLETNIMILDHIILKIDKHFVDFENCCLYRLFDRNYFNDTSLQQILEHFELLRCYFHMKLIVRKLEEKYSYFIENKYQDKRTDTQVVNDANNNESIPLNHTNVNYLSNNDEIASINESMTQSIEQNLDIAKFLLALQNDFFKQTSEKMFVKFELNTIDYYDIAKLKANAELNYNNELLTKEKFIRNGIKVNTVIDTNKKQKPCYSMVDLYLVLFHTFAYLTVFYGLSLTSFIYAIALGVDQIISGTIQSVTPITAALFGFYLNYITLNNKYRNAYFLSLFLLIGGMILYYLAISFNDKEIIGIIILLIGRLLLGMGGARLMTRKFVANNVKLWAQSTYSTILVTISLISICFGAGISAILEFINETELGPTTIFEANVMAFMYIFVYIILFILFIFFFKGYDKRKDSKNSLKRFNDTIIEFDTIGSYKISNIDITKEKVFYAKKDIEISYFNHKLSESVDINSGFSILEYSDERLPLIKEYFPKTGLIVSLIIFIIIKIIQEAFFTELPQMSQEYYNFNSQWVGWFLFLSIFYVVPGGLLGIYLNRKFTDRYILIIALLIYMISTIIKINYSYDQPMPKAQYYIGSAILFIGSLLTETSAIAIIAKVMPFHSKYKFFNAGFLSGTSDYLGKTLGNSLFTLFSKIDTLAAFPFIWYTTATFILILTLLFMFLFFKHLRKYTIIKIIRSNQAFVPVDNLLTS